ncbi:hypothetical protein [Xenorhabdus griffiniae]|uniref:Uncharacterized protein n=1 Tax=Xenorhabdus griffiniae TaxID=351672 RepID=A0ABY9XMT0_9GAMM|nr:hypothetical protein [Xenorhabdus griffiniae]MBD1226999.1 hypothetical protein [Xenorhabdus griffiniae]MBE8586127.1 hypothetical protein [Xenorhabdus griffiniae]WMV74230.1 hypothetical protein QL128_09685 [Xenorhabdus griffiniae]WNH03910.1 hypothetical protein QL112_009690 [Xenorhabdus griffiniae]
MTLFAAEKGDVHHITTIPVLTGNTPWENGAYLARWEQLTAKGKTQRLGWDL